MPYPSPATIMADVRSVTCRCIIPRPRRVGKQDALRYKRSNCGLLRVGEVGRILRLPQLAKRVLEDDDGAQVFSHFNVFFRCMVEP